MDLLMYKKEKFEFCRVQLLGKELQAAIDIWEKETQALPGDDPSYWLYDAESSVLKSKTHKKQNGRNKLQISKYDVFVHSHTYEYIIYIIKENEASNLRLRVLGRNLREFN